MDLELGVGSLYAPGSGPGSGCGPGSGPKYIQNLQFCLCLLTDTLKEQYFIYMFASTVVIWLEVCISSGNFTMCFRRWLYKTPICLQPVDAAQQSARAHARSSMLIIWKSEP